MNNDQNNIFNIFVSQKGRFNVTVMKVMFSKKYNSVYFNNTNAVGSLSIKWNNWQIYTLKYGIFGSYFYWKWGPISALTFRFSTILTSNKVIVSNKKKVYEWDVAYILITKKSSAL